MDASQYSRASNTTLSSQSLKRASDDVGWDFAILADPTNLDKLQCKLCGKKVSGGIHRIKQHIAHIKGNVASCPKSSNADKTKCIAAIEEAKAKKRQKNSHSEEVREEVQLARILEENEEIEVGGSREKPLDDNYDRLVEWWSNYGNDVPKLQRMAIRILSLTTSTSGCERSWSTFEGIRTKKRNRLDATRLRDLVCATSGSTSSLESVLSVSSDEEEPPDSSLFPTATQSSSKDPSFTCDCKDLSSLFCDLDNLLRPTTGQAAVDNAKQAIQGILRQGFDALTDSEAQKAFLASTEVLLSAGVFPSDTDFRTRLKVFMKELPHNASTFLQAKTDIHMALELSSLQDFLKDQAAKLPTVQERLRISDEKIARRKAKLDTAYKERAKMNEAVAAYVEETKVAKQKLATLNPQAADIESKKLTAEEFVRQCHSSWGGLKTSLSRLL